MISDFAHKIGAAGTLVEGEPVLAPSYAHAEDTDAFSIELPNGELLTIEYDADEPTLAHIFILASDAKSIVKKVR